MNVARRQRRGKQASRRRARGAAVRRTSGASRISVGSICRGTSRGAIRSLCLMISQPEALPGFSKAAYPPKHLAGGAAEVASAGTRGFHTQGRCDRRGVEALGQSAETAACRQAGQPTPLDPRAVMDAGTGGTGGARDSVALGDPPLSATAGSVESERRGHHARGAAQLPHRVRQ